MRSLPIFTLNTTILALLLAGCSSSIFKGELAGYDGLATKIRFYYADNALEENGMCRRPELQAITRTDVIEDTSEKLVLQIRYHYQDNAFAQDFGDGENGALILFSCRGFENRTFVVDKTPEGLVVASMTGAIRHDRNFATGA